MNKVPKKRGRKPKGGKVTAEKPVKKTIETVKRNIILHLKCKASDLNDSDFLSELKYNPIVESVQAYDQNKVNEYSIFDEYTTINQDKTNIKTYSSLNEPEGTDTKISHKHVKDKLNQLQNQLHHNVCFTKKADCFWCTCNFDTPIVYIPKCKLEKTYEVYGCFCSPECAVAYLYNENIATSSKWERYSLLHSLYSKIYEYNKNIIPAPEPRYLLSKFFGNLSIQEYRTLYKCNQTLNILDKPITRILPEVYKSNDIVDINDRFHNLEHNREISKYRLSRNKTSVKPMTPFDYHNEFWKDNKHN